MSDPNVIVEKTYNAPVEKVWRAITEPEQMKQWYFDIPGFRAEVGFEFQFYGEGHKGEKYLHLCKVTEVIKQKKLSYSWRYEGFQGISFVSFELFKEADKTRLKLTHTGLDSFPHDNPDFARASFNEGWKEIIGTNLEKFLQKK